MIIWSIFWGAVLGWFWPGYGDFGVFLGGFLGLFAGLSLRWAVRAEVEVARRKQVPQVRTATVSAPHAPAVRSGSIQAAKDDGGFRDFENTSPLPASPLPAQRAVAASQTVEPVTDIAQSAVSNEEASLQEDLAPNGLPRTQAAPTARPRNTVPSSSKR